MAVPKWTVALAFMAACGCGSRNAAKIGHPTEADGEQGAIVRTAQSATDAKPVDGSKSQMNAPRIRARISTSDQSGTTEPGVRQIASFWKPWQPPTEELQLIQSIRERPWDEHALAKYAEWLDATDAARAQLVRSQITLSNLDDEDPRYSELDQLVSRLEADNRQRWTKHLGELADFVSFRFGIIDRVDLINATDDQLALLSKVAPETRILSLDDPLLTLAGYRTLSQLPCVDEVTVTAEAIPEGAVQVLASLPPWTYLNWNVDEIDPTEIEKSTEFRIGRVKQLPPDEQANAACRFLGNFDVELQLGHPTRHVNLNGSNIGDVEFQLLAGLPDLEILNLGNLDVTSKGIAHLAGLTNIKVLRLDFTKVTSLAALAGLTKLEELSIIPQFDTVMGDDGLAVIEHFTQLKEVYLNDPGITDQTVERLANLKLLKRLKLKLSEIKDEHCLSALSGMDQIESLTIQSDSISDNALKYLSGLSHLELLNIRIDRGNGTGFRHLSRLANLRQLFLDGPGVNDEALTQLIPLGNLNVIMAQETAVTVEGARSLAGQLKNVTIILDDHVVKTPHESCTFARKRVSDAVSLLLPVLWTIDQSDPDFFWATEDGWEKVIPYSGDQIGPASILIFFDTEHSSPRDAIRSWVNKFEQLETEMFKENVQPLGRGDSSDSCLYLNEFGRHLLAATKTDAGILVFEGSAKGKRFNEFEALFKFIAQSVRIGADPTLHANQTVELKTEQLLPK